MVNINFLNSSENNKTDSQNTRIYLKKGTNKYSVIVLGSIDSD